MVVKNKMIFLVALKALIISPLKFNQLHAFISTKKERHTALFFFELYENSTIYIYILYYFLFNNQIFYNIKHMSIKLDTSDNYCLYLDTTNNYCYAALYKTDLFIGEIKAPVNKNVTDIIVDAIDKLLDAVHFKKEELKHMCVNIGPGTFTGVKVGVVVAKAWKLTNPKLKITTTNSLLLQCNSLPALSVIDAKSNKLYVAAFNGFGKAVLEPTCIAKDQLPDLIKKYKDYTLYQDQVDNMYENYTKYLGLDQPVKDMDKFNPLYLKDPV